MLPSSIAGGGADKYFCDYFYQATGNRVASVGGAWANGGRHGPFLIVADASSVYATIGFGGRLLCT